MRTLSRALACAASAAALTASGCFTSDSGLGPPRDTFYFPTALVVSPGKTALYVANSDFDLQYNGGTVQLLDLPAIRATARKLEDALSAAMTAGQPASAACAAQGLGDNTNDLLDPIPCSAFPSPGFVRASQTIGAFASAAVFVPRDGAAGARLFVTVRGDPSVTFFDVADDRGAASAPAWTLSCGGGSEQRCAAAHRLGEDPDDNLRHLVLPTEPVGIAALPSLADGASTCGTPRKTDPIVVANQTTPAVSLFVNRWDAERPRLEFFTTSLPNGPTELAGVPPPAAVISSCGAIAYEPGFVMTYRAAPEVDLIRYYDDTAAAPERPFVTRADAVGIQVSASGVDSRGIAIDGSARAACEAEKCSGGGDSQACRDCAEQVPLALYVANRSPAALLVGRVETHFTYGGDTTPTGAYDTLSLQDSVPLGFGASKVAIGRVVGLDGKLSLRVFASAFDQRLVFSYDPVAHRVDAIIRTGRGPHAIAFDESDDGKGDVTAHLIVGHFTDSYLGVVDLDMRHPFTFGTMVAAIGEPVRPKGSN